MIIKSFSPLNYSTDTYYLNSTDFAGTELLYTDTNANLYVMLFRKDAGSANVYNIVYYKQNEGYFNGVDYDYRFDFSNFINIIHSDLLIQEADSGVTYANIIDPESEFFIFIDPTDFRYDVTFESYIYIKTNNDEYMYEYDIKYSASILVDNSYEFKFVDYSTWTDRYSFDDKVYRNSKYAINLKIAQINYVSIFDIDNNLIIQYTEDIVYTPYYVKTVFYPIPANAYKVVLSIYNYSTITNYTKYIEDVCIRNQYFYYGTTNPIESICFTGKRNDIRTIERQNLTFGRRIKNINIFRQDQYLQNTGYILTEDILFSISKSPYLIEYSGSNISYWLLNETVFEGFNTKSLDGRNLQLGMSKRTQREIYTGFSNGYYS